MEDIRVQDFAELYHYKDENTKLLKNDTTNFRVVFFGDSTTKGWIEHCPDFFKETYVNRGINGQTTSQMLLRFRQDVIHLKPDILVLMAGVNDIAQNKGPVTQEMIVDGIVSMIELAKINHIKVILCSVLPAYDFYWRPGLEPADKIVSLNNVLKEYAEKNTIEYVDYFPLLADENNALKKEFGEDGVHPNALGYKQLEPLIQNAISKVSKI